MRTKPERGTQDEATRRNRAIVEYLRNGPGSDRWDACARTTIVLAILAAAAMVGGDVLLHYAGETPETGTALTLLECVLTAIGVERICTVIGLLRKPKIPPGAEAVLQELQGAPGPIDLDQLRERLRAREAWRPETLLRMQLDGTVRSMRSETNKSTKRRFALPESARSGQAPERR